MQEPETVVEELNSSSETAIKEWRKPVVTVVQASSAENSPGGFPDAGINYS
jgi:hypothetical protein